MGKQNRIILKNYFQTGKVPTQGSYDDLIDSFISLEDSDVQIIRGGISSSHLHIGAELGEGHITASGNISASGYVTASQLLGNISADYIQMPFNKNIFLGNPTDTDAGITYSISASGNLRMDGSASFGGDISASGVVSASKFIADTASFSHIEGNSPITLKDPITFQSSSTFTGNIVASGNLNVAGTVFGTVSSGTGAQTGITSLGIQTLLNVEGSSSLQGNLKVNATEAGPISITGSISSSLNITAEGYISASNITATSTISTPGDLSVEGESIYIPNINPDTDNTVVILNGSGYLRTDEINSDVWDTSKNFVDASSGVNNRIPTFTDADSIQGESNLTFDGSNLISQGNITAGGTVLGTKGIYTAISEVPQVVEWSDQGTITAADPNSLHLKVQIREMPLQKSVPKYGSSTEYMRLKHSAITAQSILIANSDNQNLTSAVSSHVGIHFFNVGDGYAHFRFTSLAGLVDIQQGETTQFNIMILSR